MSESVDGAIAIAIAVHGKDSLVICVCVVCVCFICECVCEVWEEAVYVYM
jgi:hypothetical protein